MTKSELIEKWNKRLQEQRKNGYVRHKRAYELVLGEFIDDLEWLDIEHYNEQSRCKHKSIKGRKN